MRSSRHENPDSPMLYPWILQSSYTEEIVNCTRNPYFWAVDTDGKPASLHRRPLLPPVQRTPTCKRCGWSTVRSTASRVIFANTDLTVLKENEESGDYKIQFWRWTAVFGMHCNMTTNDPNVRGLFQERGLPHCRFTGR